MNVLPVEHQIAAIGALTEGCSIRATERLTGIHRDSVMRLGIRVGEGCHARGGKPKPDQKGGASKDRRQQETLSEHTTYDMLIGILDPANMDDDEQGAVWTLIRYLRKQETAN